MLHISRCVCARETHWDHPQRSISILSKNRGKTRMWPHMTSNDLKEKSSGQNCIRVTERGLMYEYLDINSKFPLVLSKKTAYEHLPIAYNGEASESTWSQVTEIKIPRYILCMYWCPYQLLKVLHWYHKNCNHGKILNMFWAMATWPDLMTWPEMTLSWNFLERCEIDIWDGMQ